jgi:glycosyltransferase involved in cell wall biosynthesis
MYICHYLEFADQVSGGIRESVRHQRTMLDDLGVEYTTTPTLDVDLLHLNLVGPRSVYYASRARRCDVPVVIHTHVTAEDFGDSFRFTNALAKPLRPYLEWAYGLGDHLVCPSEYNSDLIAGYTDTERTVITNGVDEAKFDDHESFREEYQQRYDLDSPVVFMVGHVIKRKGLQAFVETAAQCPDLDFVWFGPLDLSLKGRSTRRLIEQAPDNCTFTGYVEDIRGAYAAGDIFLFPTHEENEGIALLEAMTTGTPIVVRDIDPFAWLEAGKECLKRDDEFVSALRELRDPDRRAELGAAAAERATEFSLSTVGKRYETLYEEVA